VGGVDKPLLIRRNTQATGRSLAAWRNDINQCSPVGAAVFDGDGVLVDKECEQKPRATS